MLLHHGHDTDSAVSQDHLDGGPLPTSAPSLRIDAEAELFGGFDGGYGPGEEFALRWRDFDGDSLRIERAVKRVKKGKEKIGKPKTKKSIAKVYVPQSLQVELANWKKIVQPKSNEDDIFPSRKDTPKDAHNYLRRHLKPPAEKLQVPGLTFQSLRRSFATLSQGKGTSKDVQTQMRHQDVLMTLNVHTQPIPQSVKNSVESLDTELQEILDTIGQESKSPAQ